MANRTRTYTPVAKTPDRHAAFIRECETANVGWSDFDDQKGYVGPGALCETEDKLAKVLRATTGKLRQKRTPEGVVVYPG